MWSVDVEKGLVYGTKKDILGGKKIIGYKHKNGIVTSTFIHNSRTSGVELCRIIYLSVYKEIIDNLIVGHKDGDKSNNRIHNLDYIK